MVTSNDLSQDASVVSTEMETMSPKDGAWDICMSITPPAVREEYVPTWIPVLSRWVAITSTLEGSTAKGNDG